MSRGKRLGIAALVVAIHVAAVLGLIRAFAPDFSTAVVESVTSAFEVTITAPPEPSPTPPPAPDVATRAEGEAAPPGKRATPREAAAPRARVVLSEEAAPRIASTGSAQSAGAAQSGEGSGAGGGGDGSGGGGSRAAKAVKVAGDINSSRDYPKKTRELRRGDNVVIVVTVGTDGIPKGCRIHRASRDPEADRITCGLAIERFRFRPALDARGEPIEAEYGWQQRWFAPQEN
ncbi:MAG TPA: energy transducer TonB [Novosphingobium sp.]|nr:energy transducer TonB [Novosphingobium sp.]